MDVILSVLREYGPNIGLLLISTGVLALVVRKLWEQTGKQWERLVSDLKEQFVQRLSDKNAELSQVWSELRSEREEKRRAQAQSEGFESLLRREQELTKAALEEAQSWRDLYKGGSGRS